MFIASAPVKEFLFDMLSIYLFFLILVLIAP